VHLTGLQNIDQRFLVWFSKKHSVRCDFQSIFSKWIDYGWSFKMSIINVLNL
jgi:hypothetical protein